MFGKKSGPEKRCGKCGETKSVKEFNKRRGSQDGLQWDCKACAKKYHEKYRQTEMGKEAEKQYRQSAAGKESGHKGHKRYRQTEKGKETRRKALKKYKKSEKGRQAGKKRESARRTRKTQAGGSYTADQWFSLCKFYNFRCLKCNKKFPFEKLSVDHVKPVSKGGSSDIWNTQPLCGKCNSKKGDKEIDYRQTLPDWIKRDGPIWIQDTLF